MTAEFETYSEFLADGKRGARLTNSVGRAKMTRNRLQALILQGFGQGRGNGYMPWICVTRGNSPRCSNHFVAVTSIQEKPLHLMSCLEYGATRVAHGSEPKRFVHSFLFGRGPVIHILCQG